MTPASKQLPASFKSISPLTRIHTRDRTLHELLAAAQKATQFEIEFLNIPPANDYAQKNSSQGDYAQIDPSLTVASQLDESAAAPRSGLSYAGFTPQQRLIFLKWLKQPTNPAASAYQVLHLAHIETCLFEKEQLAEDARTILRFLHETESWAESEALARAMLLALWLKQDSTQLINWLEMGGVHGNVLGVALGHAALLGQILTPKLLSVLMTEWRITSTPLDAEMARAALSSLTSTLGAEPLAHALQELGEEAQKPKPWRSAHRELRIALPQPDLRPILEPLFHEAKTISAQTISSPADAHQSDDSQTDQPSKWALVLEFQQSRSEYFDFALHKARQRPGYSQIMDENRQIVYRVTFLKRETRHFWSLWEYVQNWNGTAVYLNGKAVEKWKIWPYSPHLR